MKVQFTEDVTIVRTALGLPGHDHVWPKGTTLDLPDDDDLLKAMKTTYGERLVVVDEKPEKPAKGK